MDHAQHERSADTRQTPCHRQQPPIVPCAIDNKQSTDQRVYSVNSMSTERQPMSDDDGRFKRGHDNTLVQYNGWTQPSWAVRSTGYNSGRDAPRHAIKAFTVTLGSFTPSCIIHPQYNLTVIRQLLSGFCSIVTLLFWEVDTVNSLISNYSQCTHRETIHIGLQNFCATFIHTDKIII